jgi:hypothetical protein
VIDIPFTLIKCGFYDENRDTRDVRVCALCAVWGERDIHISETLRLYTCTCSSNLVTRLCVYLKKGC